MEVTSICSYFQGVLTRKVKVDQRKRLPNGTINDVVTIKGTLIWFRHIVRCRFFDGLTSCFEIPQVETKNLYTCTKDEKSKNEQSLCWLNGDFPKCFH